MRYALGFPGAEFPGIFPFFPCKKSREKALGSREKLKVIKSRFMRKKKREGIHQILIGQNAEKNKKIKRKEKKEVL